MSDSSEHVNGNVQVIGSELAQRMLKRHLQNLAAKLKAGEVLKPNELNLIRDMAEVDEEKSPRWAKNKVELANALGVNRKSIDRWWQEQGHPEPASDGRHDVEAWKEWAAEHGHKFDDAPSLQTLKARALHAQIAILEQKLAIQRREFVSVSEVESIGASLGAAIRKVVTGLHLQAPNLAGTTVEEAEKVLIEIEDDLIRQLQSLGAEIEKLKESKVEDDEDEQREEAEGP